MTAAIDRDESSPRTGEPATPGSVRADIADCFHCGLPVPPGQAWPVSFRGRAHPTCCPGCQAVAATIIDSGHGSYYDERDAPSGTPAPALPAPALEDGKAFEGFVRKRKPGQAEISLLIEGIHCAACVWLIESRLHRIDGVHTATVNFATHRARVVFDPARTGVARLLEGLARVGYPAAPYDVDRREQALARERRDRLRRLGIAGLFMMQLMTAAVALYFGEARGMDAALRELLRWVNLALVIPVLAYSAAPIFHNAWRSLRNRRAGMDVPVSLALVLLFVGSTHATVTGHGEIYFESAAMFVFFLLAARYVEFAARLRSADAAERLNLQLPATVTRIRPDGGEENVPAAALAVGDRVRLAPGATAPVDGRIVAGSAAVSEALLSGESEPVRRREGEGIHAGALVTDSPLEIEVTATGSDTLVAQIAALAERAQSAKPPLVQLADRVAGWFTVAIVVIAAGVALYWWSAGNAHWLAITVSVLVVTCPCALSLAMPTALAAGNATLLRNGVVVTRSAALEKLTRADVMVLDKTGTLTLGQPRVQAIETLGADSAERCLGLAAALESWSEHPVAGALVAAAGPGGRTLQATDVTAEPGLGLTGVVQGERYWIGHPAWVSHEAGIALPGGDGPGTEVLLARAAGALCRFRLHDEPRPEAAMLIQALRAAGRRVMVLSGDRQGAVDLIAGRLGIAEARGGLRPEDKLVAIRALQADGHRVAMVGDGVNDAPVLAAADVAVAMGAGTDLARARADVVLLDNRLDRLAWGFDTARRCLRIVRQNLVCSAGYNTLALPLAMAGFVTPWLAAIGMSASSLVVVLNAMRMLRVRPGARRGNETASRVSASPVAVARSA